MFKLRVLLRFAPCLAVAFAQNSSTGGLSQAQSDFFQFMLTSIANPDDNPAGSARRQQAVIKRYGLNGAEAQVLAGVGEDFRAELAEIDALAAPTIANTATRTDADNEFLSALAGRRQRVVTALALRLLSAVSAQTANAFQTAIGAIQAQTRRPAPAPAVALTPAQFLTCVSAAGTGSTCQLAAGTYTVPSSAFPGTTVIARSNITVQGTYITSPNDTTFVRASYPSGVVPTFMQIAPSLTGIVIQDFQFNGNRCGILPPPTQTLCSGGGCAPSSTCCIDLDLNSRHNTSAIRVYDVNFGYSPSNALSAATDGTIVAYCNFSYGAGAFGTIWYSPIANDVVVVDNDFEYIGGAAVSFVATTSSYIQYNYLFSTHQETPPGGQIVLGPAITGVTLGTSGTVVSSNQMDGGNPVCFGLQSNTDGIEGYGSKQTVQGNFAWDHFGVGFFFLTLMVYTSMVPTRSLATVRMASLWKMPCPGIRAARTST